MKKILVSLGLILTLVLCCAFVPVNAAEECAHEKVTFQYYLDGQVAPTNCKESGIAKVKCDACKKEVYRKIVGKHNIEEIVTDATCEANQKVEIKCTLCDYKEETVEIANTKLTHNWVVTEFEATCGRPSGTASKCTLCGEEKEFTADVDGDPALEHVWEDTKVVEATCQEKGYTLQTCKNCKATQKANEGTELGDHVKGEKPVSVLKEADCKNPGVGKYECALCGEEMGYQTIPAQHKYGEYEVTDAAKCGVNAKGIKKCLVCGAAAAKEEIPNTALKHNYVDTVKDATCTEPQWAGPVCSLCGDVDTEKAESLGEELGHDWDEVIVEATCERSSGIVRTCTRCDADPEFIPFDSEDDNYEAPLNHKKDGKDANTSSWGVALSPGAGVGLLSDGGTSVFEATPFGYASLPTVKTNGLVRYAVSMRLELVCASRESIANSLADAGYGNVRVSGDIEPLVSFEVPCDYLVDGASNAKLLFDFTETACPSRFVVGEMSFPVVTNALVKSVGIEVARELKGLTVIVR